MCRCPHFDFNAFDEHATKPSEALPLITQPMAVPSTESEALDVPRTIISELAEEKAKIQET